MVRARWKLHEEDFARYPANFHSAYTHTNDPIRNTATVTMGHPVYIVPEA